MTTIVAPEWFIKALDALRAGPPGRTC